MTVRALPPQLVRNLGDATREVLETMVFVQPESIEEHAENSRRYAEEVVGLLGFTGTRCGTFAVRTSSATACAIAAKMLMMEPGEITDFAEAADGFGEVVNMIGGNFKNAWVALGNRMDLSVPNVIHRGQVTLSAESQIAERSCVRVQMPEGELLVGIVFEVQ